jgi:hypothetical protein
VNVFDEPPEGIAEGEGVAQGDELEGDELELGAVMGSEPNHAGGTLTVAPTVHPDNCVRPCLSW